jgi:phosphoribosylanthranilate isomerase
VRCLAFLSILLGVLPLCKTCEPVEFWRATKFFLQLAKMPYTPKVKVCGITNVEDAAAAVEAGADALGFVFYRKSPRYIEPTLARQIIMSLPPLVTPVGVFVDEDQQVVRNLMDNCGLAFAQLHGNESATYCQELGRPALKALRVKDRSTFLALAEFRGRAGLRGFVLDSFSDQTYGGTGQVIDWQLAAEAAKAASILLAGGLTPDNVEKAIQAVQPYGVDVSSGVERAPGKKDHDKVRAFIRAVRVVPLT